MAVGEAACVSVHGANRLGSNSLLDLVVFGREAARHCAETIVRRRQRSGHCRRTRATSRSPGSTGCATRTARGDRRDPARDAAGHADARRGVPHRRVAGRRRAQARRRSARRSPTCRSSDRSLIWNTDLVETLELDNLLGQALATILSAENRKREPRRARARGLPGARRRELAEAHAVLGRRGRTGRASTTGRCT